MGLANPLEFMQQRKGDQLNCYTTNAWFSMAHDLIAVRFRWRPQLLTRVSSPPAWRGFHAACARMSLSHIGTGQRRVYYVCHTSSHLASVPRHQSGAATRLQ